MTPEVTDYLRYLELRRAELEHRPGLHRHGLAAHDRMLAACRGAADLGALVAAITAIGPLALTRAEWLDRYAALERLYRSLGDHRKARAAAIELAAAQASGPDRFLAAVTAAHVPAAAWRQRAEDSAGALRQLVSELIWLIGEGDPEQQRERRRRVEVLWQALRAADPELTWSGLCGERFYRIRLPFDDPALDWLGTRLAAVVGDLEAPGAPPVEPEAPAAVAIELPPMTARVPAAAETAAGYRAAFEHLAPDDEAQRALYGRVLELAEEARDGHELLRRMAEEDLFTRLSRARYLASVERDWAAIRGLGQPHAERHYAGLADCLVACRSPLEVELEATARAETLAIDSAWLDAHATAALRPVAAALAWERAPDPDRTEALARSCEATRRLLGRPWDRALITAPIPELATALLALAAGPGRPPRPGAVAGAVLPDLGPALAHAAVHATVTGAAALAERDPAAVPGFLEQAARQPRFGSFDALRATVADLVDQALGGRAAAAHPPTTVRHRDRGLALEQVSAALAAPWPDLLVIESADG